MRSFRLDPDSVQDVVESWPWMLATLIPAVGLGYLAVTYEWARMLVPIAFAAALGPRAIIVWRQHYPTAKQLWLLSVGMTTLLIGVALRMAFPAWQGSAFDLTWLGVAFLTILAFVLINRGNKDVV